MYGFTHVQLGPLSKPLSTNLRHTLPTFWSRHCCCYIHQTEPSLSDVLFFFRLHCRSEESLKIRATIMAMFMENNLEVPGRRLPSPCNVTSRANSNSNTIGALWVVKSATIVSSKCNLDIGLACTVNGRATMFHAFGGLTHAYWPFR